MVLKKVREKLMKQLIIFSFLCMAAILSPEMAIAAAEEAQAIEIDGEITSFIERALNMILGFLGEFLTLVGETVADILGRD